MNLRVDREVILYGASSKDSTSARVALALRWTGFEKVRPLSGGLPAWLNRGYPAIGNPPMLSDTEHEVIALREVLRHSRMHVAQLLERSVADVDENPTRLERSPRSRKCLQIFAPGRTIYPPRIP